MMNDIVIKSSSGVSFTYKDYKFVHNGTKYVSIQEPDYYTGLLNDVEDISYHIEWTFNSEKINLIIKGYSSNFLIDPISKMLFIESDNNIKIFRSNNHLVNIKSPNEKSLSYFMQPNGEIDHELILPEFVYYKDDIPWHTFIPISLLEEQKCKKTPVELFSSMVFSVQRNSLVGSYYYMGDSIQEREYDAIKQQWGVIVSAFKA